MKEFLQKIPVWLSSNVSIFIYLGLFFYLVIFALICIFVPAMNSMQPTHDAQLILGNYTNVLSALGASIAAGSGVIVKHNVKKLRDSHRQLQENIDSLHKKIENIGKEVPKK